MPAATIIRADHPDYWRWHAAEARRKATILGYAYDPDGVKKAAFTSWVRKARRNPEPEGEMMSVKLGADFLSKALDDYKQWTRAWWREAIQNCVDSGATEVALKTKTLDNGMMEVTVTDNGRGMSGEILFNKFLSLGSSGKKDTPTATGGFGEAKRLLLFPWCSWTILTNGSDGPIGVYGQGFSYKKIPHLDAQGTGTSLIIVMPADKHVYPEDAEWFLNKCYLPDIRFTLNGHKIDADMEADENDEVQPKMVDPNLLKLYYRAKARKNVGMFVRKNGLFMFEQYAPDIKGCLIVEIVPPSVKVLQSSRDGFNYHTPCYDQLEAFRVSISKNTSSALRRTKAEHTLYENSKRVIAQVQDTQGKLYDTLSKHFGSSENKKIDAQAIKDMEIAISALPQSDNTGMMSPTPGIAGIVMKDLAKDETTVIEAAASQLAWPADFYIVNEIDSYHVPMWLRPYNPKTKQPTMEARPRKLARLWMEYCRLALIRLGYKEQFGVGWIFSTNDKTKSGYTGAAYVYDKGRHWLLLNPFIGGNIKEEKIYSMREPKHLNELFALAIHECTHLVDGISDHDEEFSSAFTKNVGVVMPSVKLMLQIRDAVAARQEPEDKQVEKAVSMRDLAKLVQERFDRGNMGAAREVADAAEGWPEVNKLGQQWVRTLTGEDAPYNYLTRNIQYIMGNLRRSGMPWDAVILKLLETVPPELCPDKLSFQEFKEILAYAMWLI